MNHSKRLVGLQHESTTTATSQPPLAIIKKHKLNTLKRSEEKKTEMIVAIVFYTMCEMIRWIQ